VQTRDINTRDIDTRDIDTRDIDTRDRSLASDRRSGGADVSSSVA
jgi:hypothetical protein